LRISTTAGTAAGARGSARSPRAITGGAIGLDSVSSLLKNLARAKEW
jgi:hypothetical protein